MRDRAPVVIFSALCACVVSQNEPKLPKYIKTCQIDSPNFNQCALENANYAIPFIVKGDGHVGIPPLNPLHLPRIEVERDNFKLTSTDAQLRGLSDIKVTDMKLDRTTFDVVFHIENLNILGTYNFNGKLLFLNLQGEGPANLTAVDGVYKVKSKLTPHNKNGERYLKFEKPSIDFTLKKAYFYFGNLLSEDDHLGPEINKILNDNWQEILKDLGAPIKEIFSTIIESIVSKIFDRYPERPINFTLDPSYAKASNSQTRDKKIRFENITKISARISGLQFLDVPKGDEMRIHNLRLEEEYLLFDGFSTLMGYLQPNEFPTDLVHDLLSKQRPFHLVVFQMFKREVAAIGWFIFWTTATVCIPLMTFCYLCCTKSNLGEDFSSDFREKCVEQTLAAMLLFFLILKLVPIVLIFIANEQISRQMGRSIATTNFIFDDLDTFVKNTQMQLSFVATSSIDITIEEIRKDFEDIEELLGRPFQQDLTQKTGIEMTLDALDELNLTTDETTLLASQLLDECESADIAVNSLQEQLRDISRQLTIARQQCRSRDRALCYTLQYTGLDVLFSCANFTADLKIKQLERMKNEKNFNRDIENARTTYVQLPQRVSKETTSNVGEIKTLLTRKRTDVYKSAHSLDELSRSLSNSIRTTQQQALKLVEGINRWELWRWLSVLGISTIVSLLWALLLCGAPCGCGPTSKTIPCLLSGVIFVSLTCLLVWSLASVTFLLGIHGESLLCRTLYDQPHYKALGEILNSRGILHKEGGVLKRVLKANESLKVEDVLKNCQLDQPAYSTFRLHNIFDVNSVTNYKEWHDLKPLLTNFTISKNLEILTPSLQLNLQFLSTLSTIDLSSIRSKISGSLTKRDLNSLADQLNTVARQLSDPTSVKRIDDLALRVRKIVDNEIARLADLRDRILYKITALDLLIHPLSQQANRSLAQLKDVKMIIDSQGWEIAKKSTSQFIARLEKHLTELHHYTSRKVTEELGRCRPLWEIFHSMRLSICKLTVDPTNGISLASFALILLYLGIVPVVLNLVEHYRGLNQELLTSITHRRARDGLIIDDEGTWASPSLETPPDAEMRNNGQNEQGTWATPNSRRSTEPLIPLPPRIPQAASTSRTRSPTRLSTIASRISAARVPQIPSVSRARSPKRGRHESLRLIEPICWKSGSLSPKSWL